MTPLQKILSSTSLGAAVFLFTFPAQAMDRHPDTARPGAAARAKERAEKDEELARALDAELNPDTVRAQLFREEQEVRKAQQLQEDEKLARELDEALNFSAPAPAPLPMRLPSHPASPPPASAQLTDPFARASAGLAANPEHQDELDTLNKILDSRIRPLSDQELKRWIDLKSYRSGSSSFSSSYTSTVQNTSSTTSSSSSRAFFGRR